MHLLLLTIGVYTTGIGKNIWRDEKIILTLEYKVLLCQSNNNHH